MASFASIASRLSGAPRRYLQSRDGVEEPAGGRGRRYWVVSRGLCQFFKVPILPDAVAARKVDALTLEIERLSSFSDSGSHYDLGTGFAGIWIWDQAAVRVAAESIGIDVSRLQILPETALRPSADDGVRLVAALDGVEGQSWSNGGLAASRWWPAIPDDRAWMMFQRGASIAPGRIDPVVPEPLTLPWLERPWTHSNPNSFDLGRVDLRLAAACAAALLVIGYGYFGAEWLRLANQIHHVRADIAAHSGTVSPVIKARSQALENLAAVRALSAFDTYPSQLSVMAHVAEILPKIETHLTEWNYDHGQLSVTLASAQPLDAVFFVRALERIDGFTKVAAERSGGQNTLHIRLVIDPK